MLGGFATVATLLLLQPAAAVRARSGDQDQPLSCRERPYTLSKGSFKVKLELTETALGGVLNVPCGPGTANPTDVVTFKCVAGSKRPEAGCYKSVSSGGVLYTDDCSWERVSGSCADPEDLVAVCAATSYNVTWTRGGAATVVSFALPQTRNPDKKALDVQLACPSNAPSPKASAKFVCKADGQWQVESTDACMRSAINEAAGPLPCQLKAEDTPLTNGQAGMQIVASCSQAVTNAILDVAGLDQLHFDTLPASGPLVLTTQTKTALAGKRAVLQATAGSAVGAVVLQVPAGGSSPPVRTSTAAPAGSAPCSLEVELVNLQGGAAGFSLMATCKVDVTGATLKVPGFQDMAFGSLAQGQRFKLLTQSRQDFGGKVLALQGQAGGQAFTVSVEVPAVGAATVATSTTTTTTAASGKLPCELTADKVTLQSGEPGFTIKVKCSQPISSAVLKPPGNYQPLSFGDISSGGVYSLFTQSCKAFGDQQFELSAKAGGVAGKLAVQVPAA